MLRSLRWSTALVAVAAVGASLPAAAQTPADFFEGQLVTILTGHPPGGSYDLYAQLVARHLGRHIPGEPTVVVQAMPGGGGSIAAAYFANRAPRDGTVLGILPESLAHTQILEPDRSRWDIQAMRYVGSIADITPVMMAGEAAPAHTIEELRETEAFFSCSGRTTTSGQTGAVLRYFAGANLNIVCGYDSATASILAVFRGEADLTTTVWTNWSVNYAQQYESGEIVPVVQFGIERLADLPDIPTAVELVDDPDQQAALRFFAAGGEIGRALLAPPGVPDDIFEALAEAFDSLVQDEEFLADAASRGIPVSPRGAAAVKAIVDQIFATSPAAIAQLNEAMERGFD